MKLSSLAKFALPKNRQLPKKDQPKTTQSSINSGSEAVVSGNKEVYEPSTLDAPAETQKKGSGSSSLSKIGHAFALAVALSTALAPSATLAEGFPVKKMDCVPTLNSMTGQFEMAPRDAQLVKNPLAGTWELASPKAKPRLNSFRKGEKKMEMAGQGERLINVRNPMTGTQGWQFCK